MAPFSSVEALFGSYSLGGVIPLFRPLQIIPFVDSKLVIADRRGRNLMTVVYRAHRQVHSHSIQYSRFDWGKLLITARTSVD